MVSSVSVEETHTVVSGNGVNELVNLRKGEAVLGPLRIVDLFYRLRFEQLFNLFLYGLSLWDPSSACFLDHGLIVGVHIRLMAHDCWVNAGHLVRRPRKDLFILEEEVQQLCLLELGELASN
ncbi:hypothetical protein AAC387_Pa05g3807 [Persea americana]